MSDGDNDGDGGGDEKKAVAILGCGPSGLAAAHAAVGLGYRVDIFAPVAKKSPLLGPLLLQRPIPGVTLTQPDGYIKQIVLGGSILDYRYKLYGDINIAINGDVLEDGYHAWKMEDTYDALWLAHVDQIIEQEFTAESLAMLSARGAYELIVNTAPANRFCFGGCVFETAAVEIVQDCRHSYDNTVVFNASKYDAWVRSSRIFGHEVTEYRVGNAPSGARTIRKPIHTTCRCHPQVLRTGRFGSWRNETWVDTAYYAVRTALVSR